jgi:hypothetical protein
MQVWSLAGCQAMSSVGEGSVIGEAVMVAGTSVTGDVVVGVDETDGIGAP